MTTIAPTDIIVVAKDNGGIDLSVLGETVHVGTFFLSYAMTGFGIFYRDNSWKKKSIGEIKDKVCSVYYESPSFRNFILNKGKTSMIEVTD